LNGVETVFVAELDPYGQIAHPDAGFPCPADSPRTALVRNGQLYLGGNWSEVFVSNVPHAYQARKNLASWSIETPPAPPELLDFTASAGEPGDIWLSWTQPETLGWERVRIFRSTTGAALTPSGGLGQTMIYEGSGDSYVDTGRSEGVLYIYTAFPVDSEGTWGDSAVTWFEIGGAGGRAETALSCWTPTSVCGYKSPVTISTTLTADGDPLAGATVELWASYNTGGTWVPVKNATDVGAGRYQATVKPTCSAYY